MAKFLSLLIHLVNPANAKKFSYWRYAQVTNCSRPRTPKHTVKIESLRSPVEHWNLREPALSDEKRAVSYPNRRWQARIPAWSRFAHVKQTAHTDGDFRANHTHGWRKSSNCSEFSMTTQRETIVHTLSLKNWKCIRSQEFFIAVLYHAPDRMGGKIHKGGVSLCQLGVRTCRSWLKRTIALLWGNFMLKK